MPAVAQPRHRGVFGEGQAGETGRQVRHFVAVAHPDLERWGQPLEKRTAGAILVKDGRPVLLNIPGNHLAAKLVHQRLHPVADAQHGQAFFEHPVRDARGTPSA